MSIEKWYTVPSNVAVFSACYSIRLASEASEGCVLVPAKHAEDLVRLVQDTDYNQHVAFATCTALTFCSSVASNELVQVVATFLPKAIHWPEAIQYACVRALTVLCTKTTCASIEEHLSDVYALLEVNVMHRRLQQQTLRLLLNLAEFGVVVGPEVVYAAMDAYPEDVGILTLGCGILALQPVPSLSETLPRVCGAMRTCAPYAETQFRGCEALANVVQKHDCRKLAPEVLSAVICCATFACSSNPNFEFIVAAACTVYEGVISRKTKPLLQQYQVATVLKACYSLDSHTAKKVMRVLNAL
jgi:hypothetical protein